MKSQQEMFEIFQSNQIDLYKKFAVVEARKGVEGEKIVTSINGEVETKNQVSGPSAVVKGPLGEEYIVPMEKFNKLYEGGELKEDFGKFKAKGQVFGIKYEGEPVEFEAAWGEKMILKAGDMLVSADKNNPGDLYRIEANAFAQTYKPEEPVKIMSKEMVKEKIVNSATDKPEENLTAKRKLSQ